MLVDTWHFSFTVSDIEQSIRFYRDILGLELVHGRSSQRVHSQVCGLLGRICWLLSSVSRAHRRTAPVICWSWCSM
jgi:catechol-2,3-dioxygenase